MHRSRDVRVALRVLGVVSLLGCSSVGTPIDGSPDSGPDADGDRDADAEVDADADADDDDDADDGGVPPLQRREHADCEPLGSAASVRLESFTLATDFFATCGTALPLRDRAFAWTAPAAGLYEVWLVGEGDRGAFSSLELRRGDCVLTVAEGAVEEPAVPPQCAGRHSDEDGKNPAYQALVMAGGETLTLVAEGADVEDSGVTRLQELMLLIQRASCPEVEILRDGGAIDVVERLPSAGPVEARLLSRVQDDELRRLSCSSAGSARQFGVSWSAPGPGRYRFEAVASEPPALFESLALALLRGDCTGAELACGQGTASSSVSLDLEGGDEVVLIVELGNPHYEDAFIDVRIAPE